ncbi:MAG: aminotransferase class V-fold PLP-dependent enzyme [Candidatus Coatesbacteria bacterium]|nr:aminotransferase class V-fold PLP-dependent enzyme [Candidatus Coatesbacteria bacterium]
MHKKLFIPGPVEVTPEALHDMSVPMVGHRSKDYEKIHAHCVENVKKVLYTDKFILVGTCSSTGLMEAAVRNLSRKKILSVVVGAFSDRWNKIALANGKSADRLEYDWGKAAKAADIDARLAEGDYDLVTVVFNETSTGVMSPLKEIVEAVNKHDDVILAVDAVSGMAAAKVETDAWGIDYMLAGTQKAWSLPPGLAVAVVSERCFERAAEVENRGFYYDLLNFKKYAAGKRTNQTPSTPAISLVHALGKQAERFNRDLEAHWAKHVTMRDLVHDWAESRGFELFAEEGYESLSLTCLTNTKGIDVAGLNAELGKRGYHLSNGYGALKEKTFRIAHMGTMTPPEVRDLLLNIDDIMGW